MSRAHATDDYGVAKPRSDKTHRPLLAAKNGLHWISTLIVMSITAYFISHDWWPVNAHLKFWMAIVSNSTLESSFTERNKADNV